MARRALLVGINDYGNDYMNLRGCINDISNMRDILKTYYGFTNDEIRVVVDSRATRENIIHRLEWMIEESKPGDFFVFHFAGHGSQIRDRSGDELSDHLDEILCPVDVDFDGYYIVDDDLEQIFSKLDPNVLLEVFLDCCHSGSGTRAFNPSMFEEGGRRPRYLPPPFDITSRFEGEEDTLPKTRSFHAEKRSTRNHVLWSACRSDQLASDAQVGGNYNGAFTYYFCKHIRDSGGGLSRRLLIERVQNSLKYHGYQQIPQLQIEQESLWDQNPLEIDRGMISPESGSAPFEGERLIYLKTPYMRGPDVNRVQDALSKKGYSLIPDGVYGPKTETYIKDFQQKNGLHVDGVVGPALKKKLFS